MFALSAMKMDRWSEDVVENIKKYLTGKQYPEDVSKDEKRNLRKRAKDFVLLQGNPPRPDTLTHGGRGTISLGGIISLTGLHDA